MTYTPKRRGRRAGTVAAENVPASAENASSGTAVAPAKRRRRASTGGFHLRLSAPPREGYHRRWFNDEPGRLANAEELAYEFVTDPAIQTEGPDTRVRKHVGTAKGGQPLYAYLMETPIEEYRSGQSDKEEAHAAFEAAINRGEDPSGGVRDSYGRGSIEER